MSHIEEYYVQQAQTGSGMGYFAGSSTQKGAGIGSLLGGLFRSIFPILETRCQCGREALRAGSHILADAASGDVPLNTSLKQHLSEAGRNLVSRMSGNGIKRRKTEVYFQSLREPRTGKTQKRSKPDPGHIF
ncbi:LOW QUALITY PROTEIN: 4-alpha-glucanotransferase DPE2 [Frankliniella fusca]|uniref:4-alpha-glucanotransferase DPE2 n=1 Tax=Frankliniella fusca TaxID=407009 RepID=A0AAE1GXN2_9NEOP|nr:LOW QUALITY PROTEIN: 4-alpha-glucanotransferase DPE2 [Frankliniella fusca]